MAHYYTTVFFLNAITFFEKIVTIQNSIRKIASTRLYFCIRSDL